MATATDGYQVIARKWRPQTFDEIVGQEPVVRTLKNAIKAGRIAHAYLFVGPRGTGKTTLARIFAKCLNCEDGPRVDPPADSEICLAIMNGSCMDVLEIDGASNNGVEQVRSLREDAQYAPSQGRYKLYIIDEVHMLSAGAFNALLKILEEPPAHVKFVFATTEARKVLSTIVSRCQRFDLKPIPEKLIKERLAYIAAREGIEAEDAALDAIARLADGGMRDSQSILDQMIAFCGKRIAESDVLQVYGLTSADRIRELGRAAAEGDHQALLDAVDEMEGSGRDFHRALADLQAQARAAVVDAARSGGKSDAFGVTLTVESLARLLESLREGEETLKYGLNEKVNFEVALIRASEACRARAIDGLLRELAGLAESAPAGARAGGEKKKALTPPEAAEGADSPEKTDSFPGAAAPGRADPPPSPPPSAPEPAREAEAKRSETDEAAAPAPFPESPPPVEAEFSERGDREGAAPPPGGQSRLEELEKRIPERTKALMEELFRARLERVQRIDPKQIR